MSFYHRFLHYVAVAVALLLFRFEVTTLALLAWALAVASFLQVGEILDQRHKLQKRVERLEEKLRARK
ncbi:MAG: hypothetical protein KAT70_04515 [Thermoplasmata archaeon]|nr:hypothetical protein [Thermoplasmata archaeon]